MIPKWTMSGIIPPVAPGHDGASERRSPYRADLLQLVDRFATTLERVEILEGLLGFRSRLHGLGLVSGVQWLNGSFSEDVENVEERSPNDIDVVTWLYVPPQIDLRQVATNSPDLFIREQCKNMYKVDAFWGELGVPLDEGCIGYVCYWYSMWSHRRSGVWKGFISVDLAPDEDATARRLIWEKKTVLGGAL